MRSFWAAVALVMSLAVTGGAAAQMPTYASLEGGAACSRNKAPFGDRFDFGVGKDGCGSTITGEIGAIGRPVFNVFDMWALRGRYTTFKDGVTGEVLGERLNTTFTDRRIVLDAEVGKKTPFAMFGGTSYVTFGLRYARWSGTDDTKAINPFTGAVYNRIVFEADTSGFGPRIGWRSSIPLGGNFMIESRSGAALLFSRHEGAVRFNGFLDRSDASRHTNVNIDSATSLSYLIDGKETGRVASIGLVSEYWFGQSRIDGIKDNRHSWGPVARFRAPLQ